jgi:glycosyltransferase involved in cell wall biosynthesis
MFNAREVRSREKRYRAFCEQAALVVMMTSWGSRDLISRYGLPPERVAVVPGSSTLAAYPDPGPDDLQRTEAALGLPERFLFFPAHTWPNKNHIGLIEALAMLRDRDGLRVPLVCSGGKQWFFPEIERAVRDLRMGDQVKFVGFVTPRQLRCLYELATGVIFPSRFEGWGLPVVESFAVGAPLACSTATGLPDIVGDAALKFDPYDLAEIASAARRLWEDDSLRADLVERGRRRAEVFSPERNAKLFRAHYRGLAGRDLSAEDRALREAAPAA